jgi:hypothetical protein
MCPVLTTFLEFKKLVRIDERDVTVVARQKAYNW